MVNVANLEKLMVFCSFDLEIVMQILPIQLAMQANWMLVIAFLPNSLLARILSVDYHDFVFARFVRDNLNSVRNRTGSAIG